jgi:hypothetical protein
LFDELDIVVAGIEVLVVLVVANPLGIEVEVSDLV